MDHITPQQLQVLSPEELLQTDGGEFIPAATIAVIADFVTAATTPVVDESGCQHP